MKRLTILVFAALLASFSPAAEDAAVPPTVDQESTDDAPIKVTPEIESASIELPDPPMKLGATGDRVRELQQTLNEILGGQPIELSRPIFVGQAQGPAGEQPVHADPKSLVRMVHVRDRNMTFLIRGDWQPVKNDGHRRIPVDPPTGFLYSTSCLELPKNPLKVDGVYGQHTMAGVMLFQLRRHLPVTGEVDVVTLDKLEPMVPTNPMLAAIMTRVKVWFNTEHDDFAFWVKTSTSLIMALIILLASVIVYQIARIGANSTNLLSRWLFTPAASPLFTLFREKMVFMRAAQFAPAVFIYFAAITIFPEPSIDDKFPYQKTFQDWNIIVSRFGLAYTSLVFALIAFAIADSYDAYYGRDRDVENPLSGIIRASKRIIALIAVILICASLAGKNPLLIAGGLGAFMAMFMLIFRDYLLGIVASVRIITNKMVKVGDWIEMPKYSADGDVIEISLTLMKVQNFDKTISAIPTHAVLTESFRNWTGMTTSGGRRIKRAIFIDMNSIRVCTEEMVEQFRQIELIRDYVEGKCEELENHNACRDYEASPVNCRRLTNIGTFRAYLEAYLQSHPCVRDEMLFMVRHLHPTKTGLPVEVYAYCAETSWAQYEAVQADIFDHVLAILPEFGLRTFQDISDSVVEDEEPLEPEPLDMFARFIEAKEFLDVQNCDLKERPKSRVNAAARRVEKKLDQLGIRDQCTVTVSNRTLALESRLFAVD